MIPEIKKNFSNAKLDAIIIGVIMVLGLFLVPLTIKASFTDDFESYDLGDFKNNGVWNVSATNSIYIINNWYKSFDQSLEFYPSGEFRHFWKVLNATTAPFDFEFNFNIDTNPTQLWRLKIEAFDDTGVNVCAWFLIYANEPITQTVQFYAGDSDGTIWFPPTPLSPLTIPTGWISMEFQLRDRDRALWPPTELTDIRYKYNDTYWSEWRQVGACRGIKSISFSDAEYGSPYFPALNQIYFDSFYQSTGYGICGTDLDCVFCETQSGCENNNCFWIEDWTNTGYFTNCVSKQPLIEEIASSTLNATTFYQNNCNYATSTGLFISLSNLTGGLMSYVSSWLVNFENLFDLTQASGKGTQFGQAIPNMRGYLMMFDSLFGLPISEIFIIYLTILIGVIIFRIVRHMKGLLPFQ